MWNKMNEMSALVVTWDVMIWNGIIYTLSKTKKATRLNDDNDEFMNLKTKLLKKYLSCDLLKRNEIKKVVHVYPHEKISAKQLFFFFDSLTFLFSLLTFDLLTYNDDMMPFAIVDESKEKVAFVIFLLIFRLTLESGKQLWVSLELLEAVENKISYIRYAIYIYSKWSEISKIYEISCQNSIRITQKKHF